MTTKIIGIREFRQNMATLYKKAQKNNLRYIVLNRNKPMFKVEPLSEKETVLEKLTADIAEAREDIKKGRVYHFEEVCKELGI